MTNFDDSFFVPADRLLELRELAVEREIAAWHERGWRGPTPETVAYIREHGAAGLHDGQIEEELRSYRPPEWDRVIELVERAATKRMRAEGMTGVQIELKFLMNGDGSRIAYLIDRSELEELLVDYPAIAGSEQVRAALHFIYGDEPSLLN